MSDNVEVEFDGRGSVWLSQDDGENLVELSLEQARLLILPLEAILVAEKPSVTTIEDA